MGGGDRSGEAGGKGEGHGEAIRETDDDIADGLSRLEVSFDVRVVMRAVGVGCVGYILHGGSVLQVAQMWSRFIGGVRTDSMF